MRQRASRKALDEKTAWILRPTPPGCRTSGGVGWLAGARFPKLQAPSCQKRRGAKGTLCTVQFDFYHLSNIGNSDTAIQHVEIVAKTPHGREAGAGSHRQSPESAAA
jgi:hypothetical protein